MYLGNPVFKELGKKLVWIAAQDPHPDYIRSDPQAFKKAGFLFGFTVQEDGSLTDADGNAVELPPKSCVYVANPRDFSAAELDKWKKYIISHSAEQLFTQIFEPIYRIPAAAFPERYSDKQVKFSCLRDIESKEKCKLVKTNDRDFKLDLSSNMSIDFYSVSDDRRHIFSINMIPADSYVGFGALCPESRMNKKMNHAIYLLDSACLQTFAERNDVIGMKDMECSITEANIDSLIAIAEKSESADCLLYLNNHKLSLTGGEE